MTAKGEDMGFNDKDDIWCVYIHRNIINNKLYIGITSRCVEERWGVNGCNYSKKNQPAFSGAIQKYGWDNFEHIIFAENLTEEKAKYMEKLLIAMYQTNCTKYKNPTYGYNMTDGGEGSSGRVCSEETRRKISEANSNPSEETRQKISYAARNRSQETREKISKSAKERFKDLKNHPMYGKHLSEEIKKKLSESTKERYKNPENNPFYGKKHTEESKKKIGDGHRDPSEATRKKMSKSAKARCTEEWRQNMSKKGSENRGKNNPNAKKVYQYSDKWELIQIWDTVKYVAEEFNVNISTVSGIWLKNPTRLYRGFHWSLLEIDYTIKNTYYDEVI